jgi:hypothetical protein
MRKNLLFVHLLVVLLSLFSLLPAEEGEARAAEEGRAPARS